LFPSIQVIVQFIAVRVNTDLSIPGRCIQEQWINSRQASSSGLVREAGFGFAGTVAVWNTDSGKLVFEENVPSSE
jgi:hypothetical protein